MSVFVYYSMIIQRLNVISRTPEQGNIALFWARRFGIIWWLFVIINSHNIEIQIIGLSSKYQNMNTPSIICKLSDTLHELWFKDYLNYSIMIWWQIDACLNNLFELSFDDGMSICLYLKLIHFMHHTWCERHSFLRALQSMQFA